MLKRYQILLNEWQAEHYRIVSEKYDVSFSEMIRMALCMDIMMATKVAFPKYRLKINRKLVENAMKNRDIVRSMGAEKFHMLLSQLYFETRKATELWHDKGAKK